MGFLMPDVKKPPPPPSTPTKADASVLSAGERDSVSGYKSLISTSPTGLKNKTAGQKKTLIGGA